MLEGEIPSSFGKLLSVTEIYLSGNRLSGGIPKSIGKLSLLLHLSISNNPIESPLPSEISSLKNLQTLDLSNNHLNLLTVPKWLGGMPSLSRIFLAGSGIKGEIPEFLRTTPSPILELDLSANHLTGSIPTWLGSLSMLYSLNLSRNALVSTLPDSFTKLQDLGVLDLHSNQLSGPVSKIFNIESRLPSSIGKLEAMKILGVSYNGLGFNLPGSLANVSSLETLKLQENKFTGEIPTGFLKLRNLKELDISDNLLVGRIPVGKPMSDFPKSSYSGNKGLCGKPLFPCKF
ncbi:hypothetical protein C5167_042591 [Papaver somniferum]|uniref:Leucine-rich repeat-containing N-terminal plant-type domain-containing protein n=1 Tax=Papaver somniferum TaxID=3469 RepID=A0A4Y7L391_PAPSO|nr:hypothetical protein C5167_042591 [Papaver somniferum]